MAKKILSVVLFIGLAFSLSAQMDSEYNKILWENQRVFREITGIVYTYTTTEEGIILTDCIQKSNGSDGELRIPARIDNRPVIAIADFAFVYHNNPDHQDFWTDLKSIIIPATVKTIGVDAFNPQYLYKIVLEGEASIAPTTQKGDLSAYQRFSYFYGSPRTRAGTYLYDRSTGGYVYFPPDYKPSP